MMKIYLSDSVPPADLGSFLISDGKVYWGVNPTGGTYTWGVLGTYASASPQPQPPVLIVRNV